MCHHDKSSIFLNNQGNFRKPLKITFHCSRSNHICTEYLESSDNKIEEDTQTTCRKNSLEHFDFMDSLRCSWNNETIEQVHCMENLFEHSFEADKIICCKQSRNTLFLLNSKKSGNRNNWYCDESYIFNCNTSWSSWSAWQVKYFWCIFLTNQKLLLYRNPILNQFRTEVDTWNVRTALPWKENMHTLNQRILNRKCKNFVVMKD